MTSISSVGSAWSSASLQRSAGQRTPEKLLSKLDTDQSGGVDGTELQSLIDDVAQKTGMGLDTSAKDMLAQYDADGDGSLNGEELGSAMKNLLPPRPPRWSSPSRAAWPATTCSARWTAMATAA